MDHNERADELEKEVDRLEHESKDLEGSTEQIKSDWEARKSDPTKAPGAAGPDESGPHSIDAEDPATGESYGERRQEEMDEVRAIDAEDAGDGGSEKDSGNDST